MTDTSRAQHRLDRLSRVGGALAAIGLLALAVALVAGATGHELSGWLYLTALLLPLGLLLALVGLAGAARARRAPR